MNFITLFKAFDAFIALTEAAKGFKAATRGSAGAAASPASGAANVPAAAASADSALGPTAQIEARLTGVVVAALKEAFNRDHARLELERAQLEEERRRAEQALNAELRRQAVDRELGRLRLVAATALIGWVASVVMLAVRVAGASSMSKAALAAGWVLLLGALGASFTAQGQVDTGVPPTPAIAAIWLLVAGLAATAISLLL